ncbi:MAG: nitronate monooxygenase [Bacteroidia bacterium]|nr:nitronate monooxygenase [Bacteroidia bacterium]
MLNNRINRLFEIRFPLIQAGMLWCSGWKLASAVSNAGGLGLIGAGSMYPEILREHIRKCKNATRNPFGVNVPLLYPETEKIMEIIVEEGVKIVFTSAGNPKTWTPYLKDKGVKVIHVIANSKFAAKAEEAGVDGLVAEGFEAGGHNGREETTTMVLIPLIRRMTTLPLIAAGGIGSGTGMLAAFALGAEGVQVGTRFVASAESSAHENFKSRVVQSAEGDTVLTLKQLTPVRLIKNKFYADIEAAEHRGASAEELKTLLGRARAKQGMFEGDMQEGELEIGQVSAGVMEILPAAQIVKNIIDEFSAAGNELCSRL